MMNETVVIPRNQVSIFSNYGHYGNPDL